MRTEPNASQGSFYGKHDQLVENLGNVVADADALLKNVAKYSDEEFAAARMKIEGKLDEAKLRLVHARLAGVRMVRDAADTSYQYAKEHPATIILAAASVGLMISYFLSRRD